MHRRPAAALFSRQTRTGAPFAVQNLRCQEHLAARTAAHSRVVSVPVFIRAEIVLIQKSHSWIVPHLRPIIAYDAVMAERAVVYDDDQLNIPQADFAVDWIPQQASPSGAPTRRSASLRRQLSALNHQRAQDFVHESTYGSTPSVVYQAQPDGTHGNFFPASYRRIAANPGWAARLQKAYTASSRIPHANDRQRRELDCANSSDALLMNIFCHPAAPRSPALRALLGIPCGSPRFGYRTHLPLRGGHVDRTELDMVLQEKDRLLLVEAKLSEGDFQVAPMALMERYAAFEQVFDTDQLPRTSSQHLRSYQLLRSVLAAHSLQASFAVMLDARRTDLLEDVFLVYRTVRSAHLRSRLHVITWQEIAACMPRTLRLFLEQKYGIVANR